MTGYLANIGWAELLSWAVCFAVGAAAAYYKSRPGLREKARTAAETAEEWIERLRGMAAGYIARAEAEYQGTKRGGEKFNWVVSRLYGLLPAAVKPFISREAVADVVQGVFDSIAAYAAVQMDKWVEAATGGEEDSGAATDNAV